MRDKDAQLMMEAYNEADQRPPHNAYPAHWPLSHRGPDLLAAHQELQRTGHKQDPNRYNPINPKNNQPFEGFWAKHDKHDGDPSYWKLTMIQQNQMVRSLK